MSKLADILKTGCAPGFNTRALDPTLPQVAVPKAFKDLEQKDSASKIARDSGFTVKQIKKIWNIH
jgi:LysM repeat protein